MKLVDNYTWGAAEARNGRVDRICEKYRIPQRYWPHVFLLVRRVDSEVVIERKGVIVEERDSREIRRRLTPSRIEDELDRLGIPYSL